MDRLAALADILPPPPPPPLPPLPWWQMPALAWALAALSLLLIWAALGWRRRRAWARLQRQARAAQAAAAAVAPTATQLAAALRRQWPEADWPQPLQSHFDTLRFAAEADAALLRQVAAGVEQASARAGRAAWWSRAAARRRFVQSLRADLQEVR